MQNNKYSIFKEQLCPTPDLSPQCRYYEINYPGQSAKAIGKVCCIVVVLLFYVHGKHLRSCRDGQLT